MKFFGVIALVAGATALNVNRLDPRSAEAAADASGELNARAYENLGGSGCAPFHIVCARASTEAEGYGVTKSLVQKVIKANPGTNAEAVRYPANLAPYAPSSEKGTAGVISQTTAYVQRCPDSKIILMGYSQGAHVILDAMCGGGKTSQSGAVSKTQLGKQNPPLAENIASHVIAVLQYGDPRRIKGMSYNKGTAKGEGFFPRTKDQLCSPEVASKVESWCDSGDTFCDTGANIVAHLDYTLKYNDQAAQFIQGKIDASKKGGSPPASSSSSGGGGGPSAAAKNPFASAAGGSTSALGSLGGGKAGGKTGGSSLSSLAGTFGKKSGS